MKRKMFKKLKNYVHSLTVDNESICTNTLRKVDAFCFYQKYLQKHYLGIYLPTQQLNKTSCLQY